MSKKNGWSPRPEDLDDRAAWAMKMRAREAMPWYLALWEARGIVRGDEAKQFFYQWVCDFKAGSCLHESKWPDTLWYLRVFRTEKARWMKTRRPYG